MTGQKRAIRLWAVFLVHRLCDRDDVNTTVVVANAITMAGIPEAHLQQRGAELHVRRAMGKVNYQRIRNEISETIKASYYV